MDLQSIRDKIKSSTDKLVENGIPIFFVRDPKTKEPSVSLTILLVSLIFVLAGILNNYFVFLKGINCDAAFNLFLAAAALYFGRNLSVGGKKVEIQKDEKSEKI